MKFILIPITMTSYGYLAVGKLFFKITVKFFLLLFCFLHKDVSTFILVIISVWLKNKWSQSVMRLQKYTIKWSRKLDVQKWSIFRFYSLLFLILVFLEQFWNKISVTIDGTYCSSDLYIEMHVETLLCSIFGQDNSLNSGNCNKSK